MKIKQLHPRSVVTASPDETVRDAARRLAEEDIGALLVVGSRGPVGVFSERDLARAISDGAWIETPIEEYMTESPVAIDEDDDLTECIFKMNEHRVRHLVVVEDGDVTGMISMRDVFEVLDTNAS